MSLRAQLEAAPVRLTRLEEFENWLTTLEPEEHQAALTLLRDYSGRYCAQAFTAEGFKCGEKLMWAWKQKHNVSS